MFAKTPDLFARNASYNYLHKWVAHYAETKGHRHDAEHDERSKKT